MNHSRSAPSWALLVGLDHGDDMILWGSGGVRRRHVGSACGAVAASRSWCPGVAAAGASLQARVAGIRTLDLARMGLAWLSPLRRGRRSQALPAMTNCWRAALW